MKNRGVIYILIFIASVASRTLAQQPVLKKVLSVDIENQTLEQALKELSEKSNIYFSYSHNMVSLTKNISLSAHNKTVEDILTELFSETDIQFMTHADQVILKPRTRENKHINLTGKVIDEKTGLPVNYATIQVVNTTIGTIADIEGYFELIINKSNQNDTLTISSLGYETVYLTAALLADKGEHKIFLSAKTFNIRQVNINAESMKARIIGNKSRIPFGALYMDTHGQQTALFIRNKWKYIGQLLSVSYFLSSKGNTEAPFRVRIYAKDSLTGMPGKNLMKEILVVKPDQGRGWYSIDVSYLGIEIPPEGFFVAMEGIFPNDYDYYLQGK